MGRGEVVPLPSGTPTAHNEVPAPQRLLSKGRTCIASAVVAAYRPWGVAVMSKAPNEAQGPSVVALLRAR
jgi:hypothetical protein